MSLSWLDDKPTKQQLSKQSKSADKNDLWKMMSAWINDKNAYSPYPSELETVFCGPQQLLHYFQCSPYIIELSHIFNNYNLYQMNQKDALTLIKEYVLKTNFSPPFIRYSKKIKDTALYKILRKRCPHLKSQETAMLCQAIDADPNKDVLYETLGLSNPKKTKCPKKIAEKIEVSEQISELVQQPVDDDAWTLKRLLGMFVLKEVENE